MKTLVLDQNETASQLSLLDKTVPKRIYLIPNVLPSVLELTTHEAEKVQSYASPMDLFKNNADFIDYSLKVMNLF